MSSPDHEELERGPRSAAISNAMVQLLQEYTGRGPTRARTTIADDLIVCVLADTLTKSEWKLVQAGEERIVLDQRSTVQRLMRDEAVAAIEGLSGRTVAAFMSNNHIDPDLAVETFVLDPHPRELSPRRDTAASAPRHREAGDPASRWSERPR
jgi:uncharacterized protein YbcI